MRAFRKIFSAFFLVHTVVSSAAGAFQNRENSQQAQTAQFTQEAIDRARFTLQNRFVREYFPQSLKSDRQTVELQELNRFKRDIFNLWKIYYSLGIPYEPEFLHWWQ